MERGKGRIGGLNFVLFVQVLNQRGANITLHCRKSVPGTLFRTEYFHDCAPNVYTLQS